MTTFVDASLIAADSALRTLFAPHRAGRPTPTVSPEQQAESATLSDSERKLAGALMRVNHVGEICAQALYTSQALSARLGPGNTAAKEELARHLEEAGQEETDHLAWCADRLRELDSRPSLLNPLWYAGSYAIGALAGLRGDGWNLGFVVETERQVEAHLAEHLQTLPEADGRSRAILRTMKADEARHADHAEAAGARRLPQPIPRAMAAASKLMKSVAYRL